MTTEKTYSISELAGEFDTTLRTIRYYEQEGLIKPRRFNTTRIYSQEDRELLSFIMLARSAGVAVDQIRSIIHVTDDKNDRLKLTLEQATETLKNLLTKAHTIHCAIAVVRDMIDGEGE